MQAKDAAPKRRSATRRRARPVHEPASARASHPFCHGAKTQHRSSGLRLAGSELQRLCAGLGDGVVLITGSAAHPDRPHDFPFLLEGNAASKNHDAPVVGRVNAEELAARLRMGRQILGGDVEGSRRVVRASPVVLPKLVAFVVTGECPEQGVRRGGKRVGHRDTTPRETLLQILREEQSASGFCRS